MTENEKRARKLSKALYDAMAEVCLRDEFIDLFYDLSEESNAEIIFRTGELLDRRGDKLQKEIDKKLGVTKRDICGKPIAGRYPFNKKEE